MMTPTCLQCGMRADQVSNEPGKYWQYCTFECREEHLAKLDRELSIAVRQVASWQEKASRIRTARRAASRPVDTTTGEGMPED